MEVFIDLTQEELRIAKAYAKAHALTLEIAFKSALFEKIKAEYEYVLADALAGIIGSGENDGVTGENA